jgi:hypothetical protein
MINYIWGIILISTSLKVWISQIIIAFSPILAEKINIIEPESNMDKTYFLDLRGSAIWDALSLWLLPIAGILLIFNNDLWIYFGLVGGGMYLYFVGRTITSNLKLHRNEINIGKSKKVKVKLLILTFWGLVAIVTIILALMELSF